MSIALFFGFLLGVIAILVVEGFLVAFFIRKLRSKNQIVEKKLEEKGKGGVEDLDARQSLDYAFRKQVS